MAVIVRIVALVAALGATQLLPPPGDGDIRVAYYELQNQSEVWLTLEPRALNGDRAPLLTFTHRFSGNRQKEPAREVEVRASAGLFWAPRAELWFELDGREVVNLGAAAPNTSLLEGTPDYWMAHMPVDVVRRMVRAQRINGSSLGFPFELSASQRQSIRVWLERVAGES